MHSLYRFKSSSLPVKWTFSEKKSNALTKALLELDGFVSQFRLDSRAAAIEMLMFCDEQFAPPKSTSTVPLPRLIKAEISPRTAEASGQQDDVCHKGKKGRRAKTTLRKKNRSGHQVLTSTNNALADKPQEDHSQIEFTRTTEAEGSIPSRKSATVCKECGKEFKSTGGLKKHRLLHTGEKPFLCITCDKSFTQKGTMQSHMRTHEKKQFTCDACGCAFTFLRGLQEHMRTHTGERPYVCDLCGNSYVRRSNFAEHMTLHSGEKRYRCKFCDRTFRKSCSRTKHERIHTGVKPFVCLTCGASFTQKYNLTVHFRKHAKESSTAGHI